MYFWALTLQSTANPWLMFLFSKKVREHTIHLLMCRTDAQVIDESACTKILQFFAGQRVWHDKSAHDTNDTREIGCRESFLIHSPPTRAHCFIMHGMWRWHGKNFAEKIMIF